MLLATGLAIGMLLTGSLNTVSNEFMDKVHVMGLTNPSNFWSWDDQGKGAALLAEPAFNHPFVQAEFMFMGEAFCILLFLAKCIRERRTDPTTAWRNVHGWRGVLCYSMTASCDLTATSIMYAGLALSSASIYQMLRGSIIVFTAMNSAVLLRRRLYSFQWASIAIVVLGICIVGFQSLTDSNVAGSSNSTTLLGMGLILLAQCIQSFQAVAQEKFLGLYNTPGLLLVGLEGLFGGSMLLVLLIPMYYVKIGGYPIEDASDAWAQICNSPSKLPTGRPEWQWPVGNALVFAIVGNIISIAFFNVFGINITKFLSGAHRMVLDSMRTFIVWGVALILGWETFHPLQLVGFLIMLFGTAMYNEYVRFPFLFAYTRTETATCRADARDMPLKEVSEVEVA